MAMKHLSSALWTLALLLVLVGLAGYGVSVKYRLLECRAEAVCECVEPQVPAAEAEDYPEEDFPLEDWVCVTTEEDYSLMSWATDIEEAAELYEDIMGKQQAELEWWREYCVYKKAAENRELETRRLIRQWRREIRVKAAERAVDEHLEGETSP